MKRYSHIVCTIKPTLYQFCFLQTIKFHDITPVGKIPHIKVRRNACLKHNFLSNMNRRKTACTGIYVEHVLLNWSIISPHLPAIWEVDNGDLPEISKLLTSKLRLLLLLSNRPNDTHLMTRLGHERSNKFTAGKEIQKFSVSMQCIYISTANYKFFSFSNFD